MAMTVAACATPESSAPSAAAAASPAAATAPATAPMTAAAYVAEAARGDMYEIQASQLAQAQASSPAVKSFAAQMVRDHTASTEKVKAAAAQANVSTSPPPALDDRRQSMLDQLKAAKGADFDRLYLQQQTMAHQDALTLHQGYAQNGDSAPLRAAAGSIAPVVQRHLTMLQDMKA
jgi:putative membrane protein